MWRLRHSIVNYRTFSVSSVAHDKFKWVFLFLICAHQQLQVNLWVINQHCISIVLCYFNRCKALIVGGGTGGCAIGAKLSSDFGQNECIILEPASEHYYQPMFTLIGGGIKTISQSRRSMKSVLPRKATWIKDAAAKFNPSANEVITKQGHTISYELLVVAVGLQLNYAKVNWVIALHFSLVWIYF